MSMNARTRIFHKPVLSEGIVPTLTASCCLDGPLTGTIPATLFGSEEINAYRTMRNAMYKLGNSAN